jgi:hypothetical protein
MKTHFLTLFSNENRKKTLVFLVSSTVLIIASQIVGINDNIPGIAMIGIGVILFYYSFVHIWKTSKKFILLIYVSLGIMLIQLLVIFIFRWLHLGYGEGLTMIVYFLICIPLLFVGLFGAFSRPNTKLWKGGLIIGIIILVFGIIFSVYIFIHNYDMNHSVLGTMFITLIISIPFVLVGILFIRNHYKMIKHHNH